MKDYDTRLATAALEPETEIRNVQQRVAGLSEGIWDMHCALNDLADRLYGPRPEPDNASKPQAVPQGHLGNLHDELDTAYERLSRLRNTVSRFGALA